MANEHIGRLQAIGLGKESTSGTAVAATDWVAKVSGEFAPEFETAVNEAAYGVIDGLKDQQTVKNTTKVSLSAMVNDKIIGHLLNATFGQSHACVAFPVSGVSGNFVVGETITQSTSLATGVLRRADIGVGTPTLYIVPSTGTFTGGQTLTGATSGATATGGTIQTPSAVRTHVFRRANTNSHPSYTIYGSDPVGNERATYCMLDSLEIECVVGDYCKFTAEFMGKKITTTTAQTPSYTEASNFLAKFATVKIENTFTALDAGTPVSVERFKITFTKNLESYQAFGDTDVASLHNKRFDVVGDMDLIYNSTTHRDAVANSTKKAIRLTINNTDVTIGTTTPMMQIDMPQVSFSEWSRSGENDELVRQTIGFIAEFNVDRSMTAEALLRNTQITNY